MEPRDLSAHAVYRAGRGIEEVARELGLDPDELVKLSSNENPFGPSPAVVETIREAADTVHTYPKAVHADLRDAVADQWNATADQVWLGAGGDGVIDYLGRAFLDPGDGVLHPEPGFAYYPMSARYHNGRPRTYTIPKADDFKQSAELVLEAYDGERIVFLTTPHNPTGSELPVSAAERIAKETRPETLVVVDEAYGEFTDADSAHRLVAERDDVAIMRTFSKAYGLAGLRLGYAVVPEAWATAYDRINTPFAVNALACLAGVAALEDEDHVAHTVETVRESRATLHEDLVASTWESGGNFVLADVGDAAAVSAAAQREGVIVRDCTSFGLPDCVRITCGTLPATRQAVEVLNEVLAG